ncbi:hypothetical protein [Hymenobacter sp. YC55]|uniref:hypothetical protein n=1 Tax=Hymenobacter sp. YC55 TaxID=3034019 RepID=UPI0023F8BFD7|nr:hypothetical protein [Hymenobacter sp. YC55]MDF7811644.1 hypothetical protein [Hymenobacter sp. YC55]
MHTTKQDWLNDALAANGCFVSGHASTERFLGLKGKAEVRFAMLKDGTALYFLTIRSPEPDYREVYWKAFETNMLGWLRSVYQPLIQLFYHDDQEEFDVFFPGRGSFRQLSFQGLAELVGKYNSSFVAKPGTRKDINSTTNDVFHFWTRTYLSSSCVVADLDAFTFNMHQAVFYELKRVKESLQTWRPYVDDSRNYGALNKIARAHGGVAITLAYQSASDPVVAMHRNLDVQAQECIRGQVQLLDKEVVVRHPLSVDFSGLSYYTSTNKRQK